MARQFFYLDSPSEHASRHILTSLGWSFAENGGGKGKGGKSLSGTCGELGVEMMQNTEGYAIEVKDGVIGLDVRDSGDCWIRCVVGKGVRVGVPSGRFYRFSQIIDTFGQKTPFTVEDNAASGSPAPTLRWANPTDGIQLVKYHKVRELVCELCRQFFMEKWVTGTGGSICIKKGDRIYMTPSGVQKERIEPDDIYVLDTAGAVLSYPTHKPGKPKAPKLTDCAPLFLHAFQQRNAGSVLHSHAYSCVLAAGLFDGQSEFRISHQEMIKGIAGHGYLDELVVPIIENTPHEYDLADSLGEAIRKNPKAVGVLVRRHGLYVWGDTWESAKRHGECLHYLFEIAVQMKSLGLSFIGPPICGPAATNGVQGSEPSKKRPRDDASASASSFSSSSSSSFSSSYEVVLLDIEGTTTPITFVKDVLFPYAAQNLRSHLDKTWHTARTKALVAELMIEAAKETDKAAPVPIDKPTVDAVDKYGKWLISMDRKSGPLKQMQGDIWKIGYDNGNLKSIVYDDVPRLFKRVLRAGNRICIYSSGSRPAQKLLFKHSNHGDLTGDITAYFDTKVGNKREAGSYAEILQYLGVEASSVLFLTDIVEEAAAAEAVGMHTLVSVRPGNGELPSAHGFKTVTDFDSIELN